MPTYIVHPSSVVIPEGSTLSRAAPRPEHLRQTGYDKDFDSTTIFYDVFRCADATFLAGPPLLNLASVMRAASWQVNGIPVPTPELRDRDRTQRSWLDHVGPGRLTIDAEGFTAQTEIGTDDSEMFEDRYCIVAMSKDNDLAWIKDWLTFHHQMHGVTGAIIYDNASTQYTVDDLQRAVASVEGIDVGVIQSWPFPFGPEPGPGGWDSRYSQISALEHARWRYLRRARGVINADPDELVMTRDGRSVFDHAQESRSGIVRYAGRWIEMATRTELDPDRTRRFVDYSYYDPTEEPTTQKWALIPSQVPDASQWRLHNVVEGRSADQTDSVLHRHFKGINTQWRRRYSEQLVDPDRMIEDAELRRALDQVFGRRRRIRMPDAVAVARSKFRS